MNVRYRKRGCGRVALGLMLAAQSANVATTCGQAAADTLHLHEVLALVAARSANVEAANAAVFHARAQEVQSLEFLDPTIRLEAEAVRGLSPSAGSLPWSRTYRASLVQGTPWGVAVSPYVEYSPAVGGPGAAPSTVGLTVAVPLLRFGQQHPVAQRARASRLAVQAARIERQHILARELLAATIAYQELRSEQARMRILSDASTRAAEVQSIVSRLVDAGERAASDLLQANAYSADRRREVRVATQLVWERAGRLAILAGVPFEQFADRPVPDSETSTAMPPALEEDASRNRPDVRARRLWLQAAATQTRAVRRDLRPQIRLSGSAGHDLGAGPLAVRAGGFASLSLTLATSAYRRVARAALWTQTAREREQAAQERQVRNDAQISYVVARAAVQNAIAEVQSAAYSVGAHERAVGSERAKLEAGFATVYDVIQIEDRLTGARLSLETARLRLGHAVARLAFEAGGVVREETESPHEWSRRLLGALSGGTR